ncbi:MAG: class I SAM-dependent methyltransferase [Bryobacterales bacterium]
MSTTSNLLDPRGVEYVRQLSMEREDAVLARLREETSKLEMAIMQISVEQGRLMEMLCRALGVKRAVEVGVFTGYSSICVARALPADGKLVACDVSEEWTATARRYRKEAGVAEKIDQRIAPASETLAKLLEAGEGGTYDFAFIDADKEAYPDYYEKCLALLRPGGMVAIDNMFMNGKVFDEQPEKEGPRVVRQLAQTIFADARVEPSLVPIGDGLLLARKH